MIKDFARKYTQFLIAYRLSGYESASFLRGDFVLHPVDNKVFWANRFWQFLLRKPGWNDILNNLTIITFNYERSMEFALYQSLYDQNKLIEPSFHGASYLETNFHHVYGKLGKFAPPYSSHEKHLPFALPNNRWNEISQSAAAIDLIRYTEDKRAEGVYAASIKKADSIFFLGFGFAKENIEKLGLTVPIVSNKWVFATGSRPDSLSEKHAEVLNHIVFTDDFCCKFTNEILLKRI